MFDLLMVVATSPLPAPAISPLPIPITQIPNPIWGILAAAVINGIFLVIAGFMVNWLSRQNNERMDKNQQRAIKEAAVEQKRVLDEAAAKIVADNKKISDAIEVVRGLSDGSNSKLVSLSNDLREKLRLSEVERLKLEHRANTSADTIRTLARGTDTRDDTRDDTRGTI